MKNELLTKGIILPSGEIGKDKINLVAGAITQPFAEMVWVTTGGDMETINRLTNVLVTMNNPTDRGKLFKIIKLLYGLMGLPFSEKAEPMDADPDVLEYFIFSFMADFGEVMQAGQRTYPLCPCPLNLESCLKIWICRTFVFTIYDIRQRPICTN